MSEPASTPPAAGAAATAPAPLRSALKKKKTAAAGSNGVASLTAGGSDPTTTATGAAASLTGASAAGAVSNAARIRAAAEEKATQLHASRAAQEQWDQWVTQVQLKLLDPTTAAAPSTMSRAAMVLTPAQYAEVREERGAARQCAWPPCAGVLDAADGKKKYKLSLKAQRVYDVEEGQHYCSPECFMQSQMYEKQLSDEPFYLRHTQKQQQQRQQQNRPQAAAAPAPAAAAIAGSSEPAAATAAGSDPGVITQLRIVEKESGVTLPPQPPVVTSAGTPAKTAAASGAVGQQGDVTPVAVAADAEAAAAAAAAAKAAAFAVEGYRPRASQQQLDLATGSASATTPAPAKTKARVSFAGAAAPSAVTANDAVAAAGPSVRSANAASVAQPAASTDAAATSAPISSTASTTAAGASPQREFLSFDPLPAVLQQSVTEAAGSRELSRAEFEAMSEVERMDWMAHIALRERAHIGTQRPAPVAAAPAATPAAPTTAAAVTTTDADAPASAEKKIKRRKTPAEKAAAAAAAAAAAQDGAAVTAASPGASPAKPAASSSSSASSSRRGSSGPPTVQSLLADDPSSGPIITPEEIKSNVAAVRSAVLPPFVQMLQCVMRWSNERTMHWMQHGQTRGTTNAPDAHPQAHARRSAFLTLVQQHWPGVAAAVGMRHRASEMVRDLQELAHTFSFDQPVPPLSAQQWAALALLLLRAVAQRKAREDKLLPADTHAHSWLFMQAFSTLAATPNAPAPAAASSSSVPCAVCAASTSPSLLAAVDQLLTATGFSIAQIDSLYQTLADGGWMQPQ